MQGVGAFAVATLRWAEAISAVPIPASPILTSIGPMPSAYVQATVYQLSTMWVGELTFQHRALLHEPATRSASPRQAFMELTADSVDHLTVCAERWPGRPKSSSGERIPGEAEAGHDHAVAQLDRNLAQQGSAASACGR